MAAVLEAVDGGPVGHQQARGLFERHTVRHREHAACGHHDLFGQPAIADPGKHPVTHSKAFDTFAECLDHAGNLAAGREGALGLELVHVADNQPVGIVDRASLDRDQHFALAGNGSVDLVQRQRFRPTYGVGADGSHNVSPVSFDSMQQQCRASATAGRRRGWLRSRRSPRCAPSSAPPRRARPASSRAGTGRARR